jgi:hypothetical protein
VYCAIIKIKNSYFSLSFSLALNMKSTVLAYLRLYRCFCLRLTNISYFFYKELLKVTSISELDARTLIYTKLGASSGDYVFILLFMTRAELAPTALVTQCRTCSWTFVIIGASIIYCRFDDSEDRLIKCSSHPAIRKLFELDSILIPNKRI